MRCDHSEIRFNHCPLYRGQWFNPGMLRPRGLCGIEAKLFGLGLVVSGLGLGLVASGLGLIEFGLVASKFAAYMD